MKACVRMFKEDHGLAVHQQGYQMLKDFASMNIPYHQMHTRRIQLLREPHCVIFMDVCAETSTVNFNIYKHILEYSKRSFWLTEEECTLDIFNYITQEKKVPFHIIGRSNAPDGYDILDCTIIFDYTEESFNRYSLALQLQH